MTKSQLIALYVISMAAVAACFFIPPIVQDQGYHRFADSNRLISIPNFWNVVSNVPFVAIGMIGLWQLRNVDYVLKSSYIWFFVGIFFTGFGSGYYHWFPTDATLVWDRLPMTVAFMSFLSIVIGEFIEVYAGRKLLYPLLLLGLSSIANWILTDDLRMYALVQFLPILLILIVLFLSKKEIRHKKYFWLMVVCYTIAKFLEGYDAYVYSVSKGFMGGHALKHLAAAAAPFFFYKFVVRKFNPDKP